MCSWNTLCWWVAGLSLAAGMLFAAEPAMADDAKDIVIVANKRVPVDSISLGELREIFLKKRTHWKTGVSAIPIHARKGSPLRKEFQAKVLQMSQAEEEDHWKKQMIRFGFPKPPEFGSPLRAVFRLKGTVSYVYRSDYKEGVAKILLVIPAK